MIVVKRQVFSYKDFINLNFAKNQKTNFLKCFLYVKLVFESKMIEINLKTTFVIIFLSFSIKNYN